MDNEKQEEFVVELETLCEEYGLEPQYVEWFGSLAVILTEKI